MAKLGRKTKLAERQRKYRETMAEKGMYQMQIYVDEVTKNFIQQNKELLKELPNIILYKNKINELEMQIAVLKNKFQKTDNKLNILDIENKDVDITLTETEKINYNTLYEEFRNSGLSLGMFAREKRMSKSTLSRKFKPIKEIR